MLSEKLGSRKRVVAVGCAIVILCIAIICLIISWTEIPEEQTIIVPMTDEEVDAYIYGKLAEADADPELFMKRVTYDGLQGNVDNGFAIYVHSGASDLETNFDAGYVAYRHTVGNHDVVIDSEYAAIYDEKNPDPIYVLDDGAAIAADLCANGHNPVRIYHGITYNCEYDVTWDVECSRCGLVLGTGVDKAPGHNIIMVQESEGDCITPSVVAYICSECGYEKKYESYFTDDHDYIEIQQEDFVNGEYVTNTYIACSRCGRVKPE